MYSLNDTFRCVSTFGNLRIEAYLQLPAAYRSLSRPSSAPDAKAFALCSCSLELPYWFYSACSLELLSFFKQISFAAKKHLSSFLRSTFRWNCNFTHFLGKTKLISQFCPLKSVRFLLILSKFLLNIFIFLFDCQGSFPTIKLCFLFTIAWWILSWDVRHSMLAPCTARLVGLDGLEPSTSRLSGVRSNHLSYRPLFLLGVFRSTIVLRLF